jgi:DNA-binding transcriptional LysR family regulator
MREFCLLASLRCVHGYACWLVDSQLPLLEVTFPFAPPPHQGAYRFLLPGPVRFGAGTASMLFDAAIWRWLRAATRAHCNACSSMRCLLPRFLADSKLTAVSDDLSAHDQWLVVHPEFQRDPRVRAVAAFLREAAASLD